LKQILEAFASVMDFIIMIDQQWKGWINSGKAAEQSGFSFELLKMQKKDG
jgi:hypothetical protein